jgi:hypothetical protein
MAVEYAAWRASQDPAQAPIAGRLVERHNEEALPTVLRSLEHVTSLNVFLVQWLGLSSTERPVTYFETLLNIEREALITGQKETFLLLQDAVEPGWLDRQQEQFNRVNGSNTPLLSKLEVQSVGIAGDLARVTLESPVSLPEAEMLAAQDQVVFFRRNNGDWKRTPAPWAQSLEQSEAIARSVVISSFRTAQSRTTISIYGKVTPLSTPPPNRGQ